MRLGDDLLQTLQGCFGSFDIPRSVALLCSLAFSSHATEEGPPPDPLNEPWLAVFCRQHATRMQSNGGWSSGANLTVVWPEEPFTYACLILC